MKNEINYLAECFGCKHFNVPSYLALLKCVSKEKKCMIEIADILGKSEAGVYKMITALEKKGYVYKTFCGLRRYIKLTEEGKAVLEMVRD